MKRTHFILWVPVLIYYGVITYFSSLYGDQVAGIVKYPFENFDKIVHASEYFFFGLILARALSWESHYHHIKRNWYIYFAMILPVAAMADEIHQYFVPSRDMSIFDWLADVFGATMGAFSYIYFIHRKTQSNEDLEEEDIRSFGLLLAILYFFALITLNLLKYKNIVLIHFKNLRFVLGLIEFGILGLLTIRFFYLKRDKKFFHFSDWVKLALTGSLFLLAFQISLYSLQKRFLKPKTIICSLMSYGLGALFYYIESQIGRFRNKILVDPVYKRKTWQRVYFFIPPLLMASVISFMSSQPSRVLYTTSIPLPADYLPDAGVGSIFRNYFILHALQFFVLGAFYFRAVFWEIWWHEKSRQRFIWLGSIVFLVAYAFSDEGLQALIPGRVADIFDVFADVIGGMTAFFLYRFGYLRVKKKYFSDECEGSYTPPTLIK